MKHKFLSYTLGGVRVFIICNSISKLDYEIVQKLPENCLNRIFEHILRYLLLEPSRMTWSAGAT